MIRTLLFVLLFFGFSITGCGLFGGDSEEKDSYEITISPNLSSAPAPSTSMESDDSQPSAADSEFDTQLNAAVSLAKQGNLNLAKTLAEAITSTDSEREARRKAFIATIDELLAEKQERETRQSSTERIDELETEVENLTSFIDDKLVPAINELQQSQNTQPQATTPQQQQIDNEDALRRLANFLGNGGGQ